MLKKTLSIAAAAVFLAGFSPAQAAIFTQSGSATGVFSANAGYASLATGNGSFAVNKILAGTLDDTLTFTAGALGTVDITFADTGKFTNFGATLTNGGKTYTIAKVGSGLYSSVFTGLKAGTSTLTFTDTSNKAGANFAGSVAFAAVPEPTSWALSILGLGLVGGMLRSRRRSFTSLRAA